MTRVSAGEIELSYERSGSGPPLLLIQGFGGTFSHWDERFLELLRRSYDVIVYDHRGVGESSRVSSPFTITQLARDAAALLQALGLEEVHVFGFSMGGMVAQELALAQPRTISTLVLGSTYCGGGGIQRARQATLERLAEPVATGDRERTMQVAWEVNMSPAFAADEEAHARFMEIGRHRRVAVPVLTEQLRAIATHDTSEHLASLKVPTLVIHGTADEMVPVENGRRIASLIPGARLEILDGAGHMFFWEVPERAAGLVREHIETHAPAIALQRLQSS